jgi:hypothetical protein
VAVDGPIECIEPLAEEPRAQLLARPDPSRLLDQRDQEVELRPRDGHRRTAPPGLPRSEVHLQVEEAHPAGLPGTALLQPLHPPDQSAHARHHLARLERFQHVVIGPQLEAGDPINDVIAGGQHDHASPRAVPPQRTEQVKARETGEHDIEDQDVRRFGPRQAESLLAVTAADHGVPLAGHVRTQDVDDVGLVIHDQYLSPHVRHDIGAAG